MSLKGIIWSAVPLPCYFDVVKLRRVAEQQPQKGTKSFKMGRNSKCLSVHPYVCLPPCWVALRPLQPALRPLRLALRPHQEDTLMLPRSQADAVLVPLSVGAVFCRVDAVLLEPHPFGC